MKLVKIKDIVKAVDGKIICGDENLCVSSVSTNSKEIKKDALFVPLKGERVDSHKFINNAFSSGALAVFTSLHNSIEDVEETDKDAKCNNRIYIYVKDTMKALRDFARYYRESFKIPVIGITGSVGKTTTKEMIATVLEQKYKVLKTAGNQNSQVGVPLTLFNIEESHEIAVIEMGMSEAGEMAKLADMVKPDIAVITNIGVSHIAQLKTRENIKKEKLNIANYAKDLFINANDDLLSKVNIENIKLPVNINYFRTTSGKCKDVTNNEYVADHIRFKDSKTYFTMNFCNKDIEIELLVPGEHNVLNALVAIAIADKLEVPLELAAKGIGEYKQIAMRGQIIENKGIKVIDDTYNASPDSMKSGIKVLLSLENRKRRLAVLADVLELGDLSYKLHYEVGEYIAKYCGIDELITVGENAKAIAKGVNDNTRNIIVNSFENNEETIKYLKENVKDGDGILVKGSRGMHMEEIVESLKVN